VDVELIPICSPAFQETHQLATLDDLKRVRLLHSMARPTDWAAWLKRAGSTVDPSPGIRFESSALAYEAASLNIGVAIATKVLVNRHLQAGSLIAPFDMLCYSGEGYYLTWPRDVAPSLPLQKFLAWMREQIDRDDT
jgi:LysR family glycine cleavage system transcriptional activator